MSVTPSIHDVFGRFQNLNLLVLLHDLRANQAPRQTWARGNTLCPVAHGLASEKRVRKLCVVAEFADLRRACAYVAQELRANHGAVFGFVRSWDDGSLSQAWLYEQLVELWEERLADAELLEDLLASRCELGVLVE
jgi:hypothetical protein